MMLNLARVAGETAPLLFTALNNQFWSQGWNQPIATLPVMIYTYAIAPYEDLHQQAWAAGFVLLTLVLLVNVTARTIVAARIIIKRDENCDSVYRSQPHVNKTCRLAEAAPSALTEHAPKLKSANLNFYYGHFRLCTDISLTVHAQQGHGVHRPFGLRQIDLPAHVEPHERDDSQARAWRAKFCSTARTSSHMEVSQLRRRVGMVFQRSNPFPKSIFEMWLTGCASTG